MRSIVFDGLDFSEFCSTEVVERSALSIVASTMAIPGCAGALLISGRIPPRLVRVRLFMDAGYKLGTNGLADIRHRVYSALASTGGGTLRLPDELELEYRDAICTDAGAWSSLFEDGYGDVGFTLLDSVAYGMARREAGVSFELVASAGSAVQVGCADKTVRIEYAFTGGESVVADCDHEGVTIDGVDAWVDVTLSSGFFSLSPGDCALTFSGCSSHATSFRERWL